VLDEEVANLGVVVALVEADPDDGAVRTGGHDAFARRAEELEVVDVRARGREPNREAAGVADDRPF
jgi:hypothetical protein